LTAIVNGIVIDASVALAWCFPDEASDYADGALLALEDRTAMVPAIWSLEIANALLVGERRKRIRQPEVRRFVELLRGLSIVEDGQPFADAVSNILPLAREYDLSAYDAAYLDVAVRRGAPLATLDAALQKAARAAGVKIFRD
jgi:predicted nucleic acid-binding protein